MKRLRFWLLDLNYETAPERPLMWLWGVAETGDRVLVIDNHTWPCFYLLPAEGVDVEALLESVRKQGKRYKDFVDARLVERRYRGHRQRVIQVATRAVDAAGQGRLAQALMKVQGIAEALEDDIRWSVQYLLDLGLTPSTWWTCTAVPTKGPPVLASDVQCWRVNGEPPRLDEEDRPMPPLRTVVWSMMPWQPDGVMVPERDPVVILGLYDGRDVRIFSGDDERAILQAFLEAWEALEPDVIVGFGVNRWDWIYLKERFAHHGLQLRVGRDGSEPHPSLYGHISIAGRVNIDVYDFISEVHEIKLGTLTEAARYLRYSVAPEEWDEWTWAQRWAADREACVHWFHQRLEVLWRVGMEFWDYAVALSRLTAIPLDHVGAAAAGFRVESFLLREASKIGELAPKRREQPYAPYTGGYVLSPSVGLHENIAVLDFKSMYPTLMLLYNISPDTYVASDEKVDKDTVFQAPTTGHRFRKEPDGMYRTVLRTLLQARHRIKTELRALSPNDPRARVLRAQEKAVKVITNAVYGYAGWQGARWYARPVAEAVTDWGRWTIQQAIEMAQQLGLAIVYGDTDSLFVRYEPEKVEHLMARIREHMQMEIDVERVYQRVLFTEAKKRYAGWTKEGILDVVGLEVVRGDWAPIAQEVQEAVLTVILGEQDIAKAIEILRQAIAQVRTGTIDWRKLVIWKTLTRRVDEYKARAPHVAAAQQLLERGHRLPPGRKVGYGILKGSGPLYQRVAPYPFIPQDRLDREYYVQHQIIPATARILEVLGVDIHALGL